MTEAARPAATAPRIAATAATAATPNATRPAAGTPATGGGRYTLTPGQSATVPNHDLTVRFREVLNDSRCPDSPNLFCRTAGEATVAFEATVGAETEAFSLAIPGLTEDTTAAPAYPKSRSELYGYVEQLVSLEPQPRASDDPRGPASEPKAATIAITTAAQIGQLGGTYALRPGQALTFPDTRATLRFVAVTSDRRCPISLLTCRRTGKAGEAIAAFEIVKDEQREAFSVALPGSTDVTVPTPDPSRARQEILGYAVQIINLAPYPESGSDVSPLKPLPTPTPRPVYATIQVTALP